MISISPAWVMATDKGIPTTMDTRMDMAMVRRRKMEVVTILINRYVIR